MCVCDRTLCALTLAVLLIGACEYEEVGYWPDSEITVGKDVATDDEDIPPLDTSEDVAAPSSTLTGPACEADEDCASGTCVNNALLESFGATGIDIPGGLCSLLLCTDDEACGPNATCIDGAPFGASGFQLCLPTCEVMADCRWEEAWDCIAPLEDQPELSVCLPDNAIVALQCGEGQCEEGSP